MKTRLFVFALFIAALAFGNPVRAQNPSDQATIAQAPVQATPLLTPEQKLDLRLEHVARRLKLTPDQAAQLRAIWAQQEPKIQADHDAILTTAPGSPERKAARAQLAADMKVRRQSVKGVLTPQQFAKYKRIELRELERADLRIQRKEQKLKP